MSEDRFLVEQVFPVTFLEGPILWGSVSGVFAKDDAIFVERDDSEVLNGRVLAIDFNRPPHARDDQVGIAVAGDLAQAVRPGDVIRKRPSFSATEGREPGARSQVPGRSNPDSR